MLETLFSHPNLKVTVKTGTEGPAHDPYEYKEITVKQPEGTTVLHEGLGVWLTAGDRKVRPPSDCPNANDWCRFTAFVTLTGFSIAQLRRIERKLKSRCRHCGSREFETVRGYPGEYLDGCARCGTIHSSRFNIAEVE